MFFIWDGFLWDIKLNPIVRGGLVLGDQNLVVSARHSVLDFGTEQVRGSFIRTLGGGCQTEGFGDHHFPSRKGFSKSSLYTKTQLY